MTKSLTEQWREGTLPEGCYYILDKNGHVKTERTCFYSYTDEQCFCFTSNKDIEEVLEPVPSYDEYKRLVNNSDELILNLQKMVEDECSRRCELETKCSQLEKRLEIATKALKDCCNDMKYWAVLTHRNQRILSVIKKALKEMEGVK